MTKVRTWVSLNVHAAKTVACSQSPPASMPTSPPSSYLTDLSGSESAG
jgi:hypothetical protein